MICHFPLYLSQRPPPPIKSQRSKAELTVDLFKGRNVDEKAMRDVNVDNVEEGNDDNDSDGDDDKWK